MTGFSYRVPFWSVSDLFLTMFQIEERQRGSLLTILMRTLISSWGLHLQSTLHWSLRLQHLSFKDTHTQTLPKQELWEALEPQQKQRSCLWAQIVLKAKVHHKRWLAICSPGSISDLPRLQKSTLAVLGQWSYRVFKQEQNYSESKGLNNQKP